MLLLVCAGTENDRNGLAYEYIRSFSLAIKNYISRDPEGMLKRGENEILNYLGLTINYIGRCMSINRESDDYLDGVVVVGVIISMFENMHGKLDDDLDHLLQLIIDELMF